MRREAAPSRRLAVPRGREPSEQRAHHRREETVGVGGEEGLTARPRLVVTTERDRSAHRERLALLAELPAGELDRVLLEERGGEARLAVRQRLARPIDERAFGGER